MPDDARPTPHQRILLAELRNAHAALTSIELPGTTADKVFFCEQVTLEWIATCEQDFRSTPERYQLASACRDIDKQVRKFSRMLPREARAPYLDLIAPRIREAKDCLVRISQDLEARKRSLAIERAAERTAWLESRHPGWTSYKWAQHTRLAAHTIAQYRAGKITRNTRSTRETIAKQECVDIAAVPL